MRSAMILVDQLQPPHDRTRSKQRTGGNDGIRANPSPVTDQRTEFCDARIDHARRYGDTDDFVG